MFRSPESVFKVHSGLPSARILCISPLYPPVADSESFCSAKMVMALRSAGFDVTVLTCGTYRGGALTDSSSCWISALDDVHDLSSEPCRGALEPLAAALRYQTRYFARWVANVVATARTLHRRQPFQMIYSRSLPLLAGIAGFWCSRALQIPWVANFNDPEFTIFPGLAPNLSAVDRTLSRWWLSRILRAASLVTYPSDRLGDFQARLTRIPHRRAVIPHVGSGSAAQCAHVGHTTATFSLVHAGKLGQSELSGRSSLGFLTGLRGFLDAHPGAACHTRVVLVGPADPCTQELIAKLGLRHVVTSAGRVSYQQSLEYIGSATVCVLIEADLGEGIFLPSKLADYLSCGKPVLALSPVQGVVDDLQRSGGIVRVDCADIPGVKSALATMYQRWQAGTLKQLCPPASVVDSYRPDVIARRFVAVLKGAGGPPLRLSLAPAEQTLP